MENIYDNLTYTGNKNLKSNLESSGGYLPDILGSFGAGYLTGNNRNSYSPIYYVNANYQGNGLAKTGLGGIGFDQGMYDRSKYYNPNAGLRGVIGTARENKYKLGNVHGSSIIDKLKSLFSDGALPTDLGTRQTVEYGYSPYPYTDYLGTDVASQLNNIYNLDYMPNDIFGKWGKPNNYRGNFDSYFS